MDGLVLKEIPLTKERTTIGRKPHNDIQIDNLAVSGEHAVIVTILNDSFLEDLGSTNGTVVNGSPIKKHFLQNNDVIELGKYKLKFIGEAAPMHAADKADFEKTMVLRPSVTKAAVELPKAAAGGGGAHAAVAQRAAAVQQAIADKEPVKEAVKPAPKPSEVPAGATPLAMPALAKDTTAAMAAAAPAPATAPAPAPAAAAAPAPAAAAANPAPAAAAAAPASRPGGQPLGAIQLLSGANAGKELELTKPLTTLGKPGVQVAVLTRRPQGYFITHVEGANRPTVNGQPIGAAPHSLKDHDLIELAGVKMEFFLKA
jgi:pSer/pThr/pTyr-binding forkhead associated (FHA) protein